MAEQLGPLHLITLEETPFRELRARQELAGLPVITHRFRRHAQGWKGCIESHLSVYRDNFGPDWLWVCEDNLSRGNLNHLENLVRFVRTCPDWEVIFVGGYILRPWDYCEATIYPQVYETRNNNHGTVSYLIHRRLYSKILSLHQLTPISEHFDIFLSQFKCHIYCPLLFTHAHNIDSNINRKSDLWRRVWFHPKVMAIHQAFFFSPREIRYLSVMILIYLLTYWLMSRSKR